VRENLLLGQPLDLVREDQPVIGLVNIVVGHQRRAPALGLVIDGRDANLLGEVPSAPSRKLLDHRLETAPGVEHVIHDQELILRLEARYQIIGGVHPNRLVLHIDPRVGGGADRDVIGVDRVVLEHLLHGDADGGAAAPHAHQERRTHAAHEHAPRELHGIPQQPIGRDE
jgi:hypothetical protein